MLLLTYVRVKSFSTTRFLKARARQLFVWLLLYLLRPERF